MEGRAARIQIDHIAENGEITRNRHPTHAALHRKTSLQIRVDGFTGDVRLYEVNILRPPPPGLSFNVGSASASYHRRSGLHLQRPT